MANVKAQLKVKATPAETEDHDDPSFEVGTSTEETVTISADELSSLRAMAVERNKLLEQQAQVARQAAAPAAPARAKGMTEMISLRNFRCATLTGHVIHFEAGKPKMVPDIAVPHAMGMGATPTSEVDVTMFEDRRRARAEFKGDIRHSLIALVIMDILEQNNTAEFDAAGQPKYQVLSKMLGFDVLPDEATRVFRAVITAQNTGEDLQLAKNANIVKRIIEAETKTDLLVLVPETEVTLDDANGMQVRDLRKAMLSTFAGLSTE
jgi:hypothetical protein